MKARARARNDVTTTGGPKTTKARTRAMLMGLPGGTTTRARRLRRRRELGESVQRSKRDRARIDLRGKRGEERAPICQYKSSRVATYTRKETTKGRREAYMKHEAGEARSEKRGKTSGREGAHRNYTTEDEPKPRRLANSATQRLGNSATRQLSNSATWRLGTSVARRIGGVGHLGLRATQKHEAGHLLGTFEC